MALPHHHRIEIMVIGSVVVVAALAFLAGIAWQRNQSASAGYLEATADLSIDPDAESGYLLPSDYEFTDAIPDVTPSPTATPAS